MPVHPRLPGSCGFETRAVRKSRPEPSVARCVCPWRTTIACWRSHVLLRVVCRRQPRSWWYRLQGCRRRRTGTRTAPANLTFARDDHPPVFSTCGRGSRTPAPACVRPVASGDQSNSLIPAAPCTREHPPDLPFAPAALTVPARHCGALSSIAPAEIAAAMSASGSAIGFHLVRRTARLHPVVAEHRYWSQRPRSSQQ